MTGKSIAKNFALLIIAGSVFAVLAWSVWSLPQSTGLTFTVQAQMERSGVTNPVTAVLLNFRAYDTLLEVGVLLLALLAVWAFAPIDDNYDEAVTPPAAAQKALTAFLVPVLVVVAAYLLWVGASKPGGAFQAGALLSGAAVLLALTGVPYQVTGIALRLLLSIGLLMFISVGLAMFPGAFLQYPGDWAGVLILVIETAAMISIGVTLALLFYGRVPDSQLSVPSKLDRHTETNKHQSVARDIS